MAGFPDLVGIPYQLMPVFLLSEIDQLACEPYIDAVESYGLPSDTCPVPTSECGACVVDALPHLGACFISSSMPCDGSVMASSYTSRRFKDLPTFHLAFPVRYEDESIIDNAVKDIKACIKFIEDQTGAKWNWDAYFAAMKRFNEETKYELRKWEVNQTPYPQLIGPCYELFRKWNYEMDGGIDPRILKTFNKVDRLMMQAYENREEPWRGKMRHRAIVWSVPAHYYANFSNWLANCWGINVLVEMESLNFTKPLEALASGRSLEARHRHHVPACLLQEHVDPERSLRGSGERARRAPHLDRARPDGSPHSLEERYAVQSKRIYAHSHARGTARSFAGGF